MNPLPKFLSLALIALFPAALGAAVAPEVVAAPNSTHIGGISGDALTVAAGSTFSFTVDTPEDKGLISTKPDVKSLLRQIAAKDGSAQTYKITDQAGAAKADGTVESGDQLVVTAPDGAASRTYRLDVRPLALSGKLILKQAAVTVNTKRDLTLCFTAGQRSPDATVRIFLPAGIDATMDNTTVNIIGRGTVKLKDLATQSIGRVGTNYSYSKVGEVAIAKAADGGSVITFSHLDLRPANGADLELVITGVTLSQAGEYRFKADYTTSKPEVLTSAGVGPETAILAAVSTIADFERVIDCGPFKETPTTYTEVSFRWTASGPARVQLMQSLDEGKTWTPAAAQIDAAKSTARVTGLQPDTLHTFRLSVADGAHKGVSNVVRFFSGKMDLKRFGVAGDGKGDDTDKINEAIDYLASLGGGTLLFGDGTYNVRTIHLRSNITLFIAKGATIAALKGADAPEATWFSDRKYRSGLSPTDAGPYAEPENWLTKQDVGHHYFRNTMFFGERLDNVKIIGNGRITGNGNLVTGDNVMRNTPDKRADKMFTLKLCTNLEIGGLPRAEDLWYDPAKDEPCYLDKNGALLADIDNMLHFDQAGHFVLLATGTDGIFVHDTYSGKHATGSSRDIYDFMACNDVTATNIYVKVTSDDIVKPGSDCSLGFTRPAKHYRVRNIVGDTNCNLFQLGSETADDIQDLCVDNIYVLGSNKAGFSISTNDGAHVKDVHLNCGHTGAVRNRSQMLRTRTPFFISISNRARILGASVTRVKFDENGKKHDELLINNVNIGVVENIILNGVDVKEMYSGSSFGGERVRWKAFDGKQPNQATIVAGYALPEDSAVEGGKLPFTLPNGKHTGYVRNIEFHDVHFLAKGGTASTAAANLPPELGVGQYNASNLGVLPAYGLWAKHVAELTMDNCTFNFEKPDGRPAVLLDDVQGARLSAVKLVRGDTDTAIKLKNATGVAVEKSVCYQNEWGKTPTDLAASR